MISSAKGNTWRAIVCAALAGGYLTAARVRTDREQASPERSRMAFSHLLPPLDGAHLEATVVEVHYRPGESSPPHTHPCPVIGYVIEGTYRTQVKGEPEAVYKAGEGFYEAPGGVHLVSANASDAAPLKFLAYFTCDHRTPLSSEVPEKKAAGGNQ